MLFWIIAALMTFAATAALVYPLRRSRTAVAAVADDAHDVEVYRDQLAEIERDVAAGLIGAPEAEVSRAEIGRRLIQAARRAEDAALPASGARWTRYAVGLILVFIPAAALTAYIELGSPGAPQLPLAARMSQDPAKADLAVLVANAERHLAANPDDGRGWDVLGPIYLRVGRLEDAEAAFRKAITLLGPSVTRQSGLGEAIVLQAGGIVTEEAQLVFQSARELDSEDPRPAYFLAIALAQSGKSAEAKAAFEALIARSPPDAPWIATVRGQIADLETMAGPNAPALPSQADIAAAAAGKTPAEQQDMVRGMVASLEEKLKADPNNLDGWLMLIRSKSVIGDTAGAQAAFERATATFSSGEASGALSALAGELGLNAARGLGGVPVNGGAAQPPAAPAKPSAPVEPFIVPGNPTSQAPGNPSEADVAAAASLSAGDRAAMIRDMVASLDARLTEEPNNIEGWLRLVRSYHVMGDTDAARDAFERAAGHFPAGGGERKALDGLAAELSIEN